MDKIEDSLAVGQEWHNDERVILSSNSRKI